MADNNKAQLLRITLTVWAAIVLGALLALGGAYLLWLGGSWYYLLAGLGLLSVGVLIHRRQRTALWLYALVLLASLAWTIYEVRFDWWQMAPRIDLWCVLGLWLLLPWINRHIAPGQSWRDGASVVQSIGLLLGAGMAGYSLTQDYHRLPGRFDEPRMAAAAVVPTRRSASEWTAYGGSSRGERYASAEQITTANVGRLKKVWGYPSTLTEARPSE